MVAAARREAALPLGVEASQLPLPLVGGGHTKEEIKPSPAFDARLGNRLCSFGFLSATTYTPIGRVARSCGRRQARCYMSKKGQFRGTLSQSAAAFDLLVAGA